MLYGQTNGTEQLQYCVDLPFPISVNQLYRVVRGRPVTSNAYRNWTTQADVAAMAHRLRIVKPLRRFGVEIYLACQKRRNRDLDNYAKCVLDWAQRVDLITNDNGCDELRMAWSSQLPDGCRLVLKGEG